MSIHSLRSPYIRNSASSWLTNHHGLSQPRLAAVSTRLFSSSCSLSGHYQTLDIPKNATRNQIKASFYKLSKKYHPDVNDDPGAKEKFQAVSEAYAVLGDERKRRAYDRSLGEYTSRTHASTSHESVHPHFSYEGRRRGATHAWGEFSRRPNTGPRYTYAPPPGSTHYSHYAHHPPPPHGGPNPFANPNVQRATGRRGPLPTDRGPSQSDRIARESGFMRTVTVAALVLLIATVGHGFSATA
ncbi:DnaJ-domain-containing protein [Cubamyces sp. BRFM 1775]|nr:DnaJ-domain-containing protein [Cubamyces sp. BRFM 1775]